MWAFVRNVEPNLRRVSGGGGEWIDECPMYRLCGVATEHHDTGPESATLREPEQVFSVILVSEKEELPLVGG